jgi:hypothetical protein
MLWFTFKVTFETIPAGWVGGWLAGKEMIIILPQVQLELELGLELGNYIFSYYHNQAQLKEEHMPNIRYI